MLTTIRPGTGSAKELQPCQFAPEYIPLVWEYLEPFIVRSVAKSQGRITVTEIYRELCAGNAMAFGTTTGTELVAVVVVTIVNLDGYRVARILACAGKQLARAMQFFDVLVVWALKHEAVEIEGYCRPSMALLISRMGFKPKFTCMTYDLRSKLQ